MAQNSTVGALEPRKAGKSWNKCWNRLLTIRTDHHKPFTAQEKAKFCVQKVPKWPLLAKNGPKWHKMAKNGTFEALEPRKAGTSWNKYWNRLLTIKTDHYEPISAQGKAKFRVKKVRKWPKIAKHGTANAVLGHFGLKWLFWGHRLLWLTRRGKIRSITICPLWNACGLTMCPSYECFIALYEVPGTLKGLKLANVCQSLEHPKDPVGTK